MDRQLEARHVGVMVLAAIALLGAGCSNDRDSTPAGPPPASSAAAPVELTIATNDGPDTPAGAVIGQLAVAVEELSGGSLRLEPAWEAAGPAPDDWDQAVARTVIRGDHALGYIPARAFDALGVHTLQALQAPFLLTSAARVDAVADSALADDLMSGLDDIGLTGLFLVPEDLRRVYSYGRPLTHPADLSDRVIRTPYSRMTDALLASVGATTSDVSGAEWDAAVASGEVSGVESSFAFLSGLDGSAQTLTTAGNLVLFPKVNVLVVNRDAFEALDEEQRSALREAGARVAEDALTPTTEAEHAAGFCAAGGRVVRAPAGDLRAMERAMRRAVPPGDPDAVASTRDLVGAIRQLVDDLPDTEEVPAC